MKYLVLFSSLFWFVTHSFSQQPIKDGYVTVIYFEKIKTSKINGTNSGQGFHKLGRKTLYFIDTIQVESGKNIIESGLTIEMNPDDYLFVFVKTGLYFKQRRKLPSSKELDQFFNDPEFIKKLLIYNIDINKIDFSKVIKITCKKLN
jgi:hypothetical protein